MSSQRYPHRRIAWALPLVGLCAVLNAAYYGKSVSASDVVLNQAASSAGSQPLVDAVSSKLGG